MRTMIWPNTMTMPRILTTTIPIPMQIRMETMAGTVIASGRAVPCLACVLGCVDTRSSSEGDSQDAAAALDEDIETPAEVNAVYQFRNPNFETEVWFVALGSEVDRHDGIRAFIDAHHNELHGAVIVDIEAIGAGTLSYARKEGALAGAETTSRMKRYVQKASRESGIPCEPVLMPGIEHLLRLRLLRVSMSLHILGTDGGIKSPD